MTNVTRNSLTLGRTSREKNKVPFPLSYSFAPRTLLSFPSRNPRVPEDEAGTGQLFANPAWHVRQPLFLSGKMRQHAGGSDFASDFHNFHDPFCHRRCQLASLRDRFTSTAMINQPRWILSDIYYMYAIHAVRVNLQWNENRFLVPILLQFEEIGISSDGPSYICK